MKRQGISKRRVSIPKTMRSKRNVDNVVVGRTD